MGERPTTIGPKTVIGGRYLLERVLGRGGFGTVYYALQRPLDRPVALKICHTPEEEQPAVARFEREARIIARLRSPHTVRLYDYGQTEDGFAYFAMELIDGQTIREELSFGPMTPERAARIICEACESLAEAHAQGVLHLDLKPGNLMVESISGRGEMTRVLDFGIARMWDMTDGPTAEAGAFAGTPVYMAPELFSGGRLSPQTDLYALGLILDECLRGRATFGDAKSPLFLARHFDHLPAVPFGVPEVLTKLRDELLQKNPQQRPSSASDVNRALRSWLRSFESLEMAALPSALIAAPSGTAPTVALNDVGGDSTIVMSHTPDWTIHEDEAPCVLPYYGSRFIGRRESLAKLEQAVIGEGRRLACLTGTGGSGKTRVAIQFGQEARSSFPGGIYFCDLSDVDSLEGITSALAQAFGIPLRLGDPVEQLAKILAARPRCLVVLDNFEQLVDLGEQTVGTWLSRAPSASFLITSREALRLPGEIVLEIKPFLLKEGMELFFGLAEEVSPGQCNIDAHRLIAARIVERLDGIPLAIELAVKRLRTLTLEQLEERLVERFRLLTTRGRSLDDRRSMMWAAIDWSWSLLSPVEQSVFAQCSIFRGGFSLSAAEAVLAFSSTMLDLDEVIAALVDKHLLQRASPSAGVVRFTFYESLREYAAHRLVQPTSMDGSQSTLREDPAKPLRQRHALYFASLGRAAIDPSKTEARSTGRRHSRIVDMENLRLAKDFCLGEALYEDAFACAKVMLDVFSIEGPISGGAVMLDEFLGLPLSDRLKALVWEQYGWWSRGCRSVQEVLTALQSSLRYAQAADDAPLRRRVAARVLYIQSTQDSSTSLLDEYEVLLKGAQDEQDAASVRVIYDHYPIMLQMHGRTQDAKRVFRTAYNYFVDTDDQRGAARTLSHLGNLFDDLGEIAEAEECYKTAMNLYVELKDRVNQGSVFGNLAFLKAARGLHHEALTYYRTARRVNRAVGNKLAEAYTTGNMGDLYVEMGNAADAENHLRQAIEQCDDMGDQIGGGAFRASLALLESRQGELSVARSLMERATQMLKKVDRVEFAKALCKMGTIEANEGDRQLVLSCLTEAAAIAGDTRANPASALGQAITRLRTVYEGII